MDQILKFYCQSNDNFEVETVQRKYGRVIECNYGNSVFKDCIKSIGYRIQVLHHATVYNSNVVVYELVEMFIWSRKTI